MPLQKLQFKAGVNKETTRYAAEGGWYDSDKVRFRQGLPEKIGGWSSVSQATYNGVCRSIFSWNSLSGVLFRAYGTHTKIYVDIGGAFYDITPIRDTTTSGEATFSSTSGSAEILVTDIGHTASVNDFVTFSNAVGLGATNILASVLNKEYQIIEIVDGSNYKILATDSNGDTLVADGTVASGGGAATIAEYQILSGVPINQPVSGWGAGPWNNLGWGESEDENLFQRARTWSLFNFGEDLILSPSEGSLFLWDLSSGANSRAVKIDTLPGANQVPLSQNLVFVSDVSRFVFCLGTNDVFTSIKDPLLVRWSDQESYLQWQPSATNQAGSLRLSRGSRIVSAVQARQELLVWTDTSLYSLQYLGAPIVWGSQIVGDNLTIASKNSAIYADGVTYWMGVNEFYAYSGQVKALPCSLLRYVFNDINTSQLEQVFAGTNDEFGEVWWFYPSANSDRPDKYVIFNYAEGLWYHGNLERSAWEDKSAVLAATYSQKIVEHEVGYDDQTGNTAVAISSHITSAQTDIGDGDQFSFMWRMLPDVTFDGSTIPDPSVNVRVQGLKNAGAGYQSPASEGGLSAGEIIKSSGGTVEKFTEQLNIRIRGRQLVFQLDSDDIGVSWQLGLPRIDIRTDGRR